MVEKWLLQVQLAMIQSLRDVTAKAVRAYPETPRYKWVLDWPGQIVIAASTVYWTKDVNDAIINGTLKDYLDLCTSQINKIVEMVRGKLSSMARITLGALTVIDVHGIDTLT
jgi:dynein heavy chain